MFGSRNVTVQRKRPGCWFYVALVAIVLNPMVWRLVLNLLLLAVQYFAVHVALFL